MGSERKARLAIRTVVVTTRAAVASHVRAGRRELRIASIQRGIALLRDLRDRVIREGARAEYEDAERQLNDLADSSSVAVPVEERAESLPSRTDRRSPEAPS
jgi:hypothetical protein